MRLTTQAPPWDRGRLARRERAARTETSEVELFARLSHLAVPVAGGTPAVPGKSLSGEAHVASKGWAKDYPKRFAFQTESVTYFAVAGCVCGESLTVKKLPFPSSVRSIRIISSKVNGRAPRRPKTAT